MKYHELKTDPDVFDEVVCGRKRFEIRLNDRNFSLGDVLVLRRTQHSGEEMRAGMPLVYNGPPLYVRVTYVMEGPRYGLAAGWVCMSIDPIDTCG